MRCFVQTTRTRRLRNGVHALGLAGGLLACAVLAGCNSPTSQPGPSGGLSQASAMPSIAEQVASIPAPSAAAQQTPTMPSTANANPTDNKTAATPWATTSQGVPKEYAVVTVYYGTDRAAASALEVGRLRHGAYFRYTAALAALSIVAAVAAIRRPGRWWLRSLTCLGTLATVGVGIAAMVVRLGAEKIEADAVAYTGDRGTMQVGTCEVRVPRYHEPNGTARASVFRFEFSTNPRMKVALADVEPSEKDEFYAKLQEQVCKSPRKDAMVFVHGYNMTFEAAAQRTAQLAYDLKFEGAPVFFSWPSRGGLLKYSVDETNVAWATTHLRQFLAEIAERSGAERIHLIAHSMGNRAVTSALASLAFEMRPRQPMFDQVVLTAPDVDADLFRDELAPAVSKTAKRVTLYANSNDEALELSQRLHGYPRAGDSWPNLVLVEGIDTIDVSQIDSSLLGHSYYGDNETVLTDLFYLLHEGRSPDERECLECCDWFDSEPFWVFTKPSRTTAQPPKPAHR